MMQVQAFLYEQIRKTNNMIIKNVKNLIGFATVKSFNINYRL